MGRLDMRVVKRSNGIRSMIVREQKQNIGAFLFLAKTLFLAKARYSEDWLGEFWHNEKGKEKKRHKRPHSLLPFK